MFQPIILSLVSLWMFACGPKQTGSGHPKPEDFTNLPVASDTKLNDVIERVRSSHRYPENHAPASFYVALEAVPGWVPNSRTDCVDQGFLAWARKLIGKKDAAQIALLTTITLPNGDRLAQIPIFVVVKNEAATADQQKCFSQVMNRRLTPIARADRSTAFNIDFEVVSSKTTDIAIAERTMTAAIEVLALTSGSSWFIQQLGAPPVKAATKFLDDSLTDNWRERSSDKYQDTIQVFPDSDTGRDNLYDGRTFSIGRVVGSSGDVRVENASIPTATVQMVYIDSLFASAGRYPQDPAIVLNTRLGPSQQITLNKLISDGIRNASKDTLREVATKKQMESYCIDLRNALGEALTSTDALVARFSAVKLYSTSYNTVKEIRSETCFDEKELETLATFGSRYKFTQLERVESGIRNDEIEKQMELVRKAIMSRNPAQIRGVSTQPLSNLRLVVWNGSALPQRTDDSSWTSEGDDAVDRLTELGHSRIGCYRSPPDANLTTIGAVILIQNKTSGVAFHFDAARKLEQVTISAVPNIRQFLHLPDTWAQSAVDCPLI